MPTSKKTKRTFQGLTYVQVQRKNSDNRRKLSSDDQQWLKANGYRNVGWESVIQLFEKIEELLEKQKISELSLEELFLEIDSIGNKYQTAEEIQAFNQALAEQVERISELVDQQFPDTEIEVIDFSTSTNRKPYRRRK